MEAFISYPIAIEITNSVSFGLLNSYIPIDEHNGSTYFLSYCYRNHETKWSLELASYVIEGLKVTCLHVLDILFCLFSL